MEEMLSGTSATQLPPVPAESNNYQEDKVFIGDVEVVVENGKFICPVKVCAKHFRRENLLHVRVKVNIYIYFCQLTRSYAFLDACKALSPGIFEISGLHTECDRPRLHADGGHSGDE